MEMSQAERKKRNTIQFEPAEIEEIIRFARKLEAKNLVRYSNRMAVLYAIRQMAKKA